MHVVANGEVLEVGSWGFCVQMLHSVVLIFQKHEVANDEVQEVSFCSFRDYLLHQAYSLRSWYVFPCPSVVPGRTGYRTN